MSISPIDGAPQPVSMNLHTRASQQQAKPDAANAALEQAVKLDLSDTAMKLAGRSDSAINLKLLSKIINE